jgi:hypothetical protein
MSVYSVLQADAGVGAITNNIHIGQAPHGTIAPYIVIQFVVINPQNILDGAAGLDNERVSIDCYGTDQNESLNLYTAARAALESSSRILNINFYGERDPSIDVYRTQFDLSNWVNR